MYEDRVGQSLNDSERLNRKEDETQAMNNTELNQNDKDELQPASSGKKGDGPQDGGELYLNFEQFCERILRSLEKLEKETLLDEMQGLSADFVKLRTSNQVLPPFEAVLSEIRPGWKAFCDICLVVFLLCMVSAILANLYRLEVIGYYHVREVEIDYFKRF